MKEKKPRLDSSLIPHPSSLSVGEGAWKSTRLEFHSSIQADSFHNVLTGERVPVHRESGQASMNLADALSICPVALLQASVISNQ
jgi:hypothetical protein